MGVKVTLKDFTAVNQARLEILSFIDSVCMEHSLEYFAFAHLLVGAVYYQGFIPNGTKSLTEIGLMRRDYDRLVLLLKQSAPEQEMKVVTEYSCGMPAFQCKVSKKLEEEYESCTIKGTVEVIISAFDFTPDSEAQRKSFYRQFFFKCRKYTKLAKKYPKNSSKILSLKRIKGSFRRKIVYNQRRITEKYNRLLAMASSCEGQTYIRRLAPAFGQQVPYDEIFPVKRIPFEDMEISAPKNHTFWAQELDDALMERTRTIQKIDLVIIREFDRVCRKIGVGYFICGGTMLGYMRHGGYIPWDDDVDVGMLRADYDKFMKEAPRFLNPDFFLQTRKTDRKIPYLFSKIRMNETEYITNYNELRDFHKGICLDLFPFDYIPNDPKDQKKFRSEVRKVEKIHNFIVNKQIEKPVYDSKASDGKERRARFVNEFRRRMVHLVPLEFTQWLYLRKATKYNKTAGEKGLTTVASFVPSYTYIRLEDMKPYQDINFEGVRVMALKDMDTFLRMQYGNYMELPDLHRRVGHDLIRWSISDSMANKYHINERKNG